MLLDAGLIALNLAVWGAHARLPWRAAREPAGDSRRLWALVAAPALLASAVATLARVGVSPDAALAQGLGSPLSESVLTRLLAVSVLSVLLADLMLAVGWRRAEPAAWRLAGLLGGLALAGVALGAELLRVGEGPEISATALAIGWGVRCLLALATVDLMRGPGKLSLLAGAMLPFYWLALPVVTRAQLAAAGMGSTLAVAALLLLLAKVVPKSLRRGALAAGLLLTALFFARVEEVSSELPVPVFSLPSLPPP